MHTADTSNTVKDGQLERQGQRIGRAARGWLAAGALASIPGIVLLVVGLIAGLTAMWAVGLALIAISIGLVLVGAGLTGSSVVSRWSARHKSFA